jgi:hypothetical protein
MLFTVVGNISGCFQCKQFQKRISVTNCVQTNKHIHYETEIDVVVCMVRNLIDSVL